MIGSKKTSKKTSLCLCYSGRPYKSCCRPFHRGQAAPTAELLMRSRYSAYALNLVDYVMQTTHATSPHRIDDEKAWRASLLQFCQQTEFVGLVILRSSTAEVTFHAQLLQNGRDASFVEHSFFKKENGRWFYDKAKNR